MTAPVDSNANAGEEGGDYYVSITDMMIGLLFLFIIILMYFALQLREATDQIVTSEITRSEILNEISGYMRERNVETIVDLDKGVLRLPDRELFLRGDDTPTSAGREVISVLADALAAHLPCYTFHETLARPASCANTAHTVEAVFIEGHTDSDRVSPTPRIRDNWDLSAARASSTLRILSAQQPDLTGYLSAPADQAEAEPVFSVAGYADQRPVDPSATEEAKARNRRIDLRFVMAPPPPPPVEVISEGVGRDGQPARAIRLGERLRFGLDRDTESYLAGGWSWPESWGVWTVGDTAELVIPVEDLEAGDAHRLELRFLAYVPDQSPQRDIRLSVNGQELTSWSLSAPVNTYSETIPIPAGVLNPGELVRIRFDIANPVAPFELDISRDTRRLGLGLENLRIRRAR